MGAPVYLTKGELRSKLLIRLGFGGLGAAAGNFVPMTDDLLEEAQDQLFELLPDEKRFREWGMNTVVGQRWYDIPAECDIDNITSVAVFWQNQVWRELDRGIDISHDSDFNDFDDDPYRYDIRYNPTTGKTQIELWPKPDAVYQWKIEGRLQIGTFVADTDRASFDSRLILLYAIAMGKAHLKRPDAQIAMDAWNLRLKQLQGNQHGTKRYLRRNPNLKTYTTPSGLNSIHLPRPKVV